MTRGKNNASSEVGYGKPPPHTGWKAGTSGNPKGRPKGAPGGHKLLLAHLEPTRNMILEQAYRLVKARDGDRVINVPAIAAVINATIKSAVSGGQMAQRTFIELTQRSEQAVAQANSALFDTLITRKLEGGLELKRRRAAGLPDPPLLPHPDDIVLDWQTLTAEVRGPTTPEGLEALDKLLAQRDSFERGFAGLRAEAKVRPRDWTLPLLAKQRRTPYFINDNVPERCRKRLVGRMTEEEVARAEDVRRRKLARRRRRAPARRRSP